MEILVRASRELPSFSEEQILAAVGKANTDSTPEERSGVLRTLSNADILQSLPRSGELQLNPLVLEFTRGLTREHELGLSSVLQARVEATRDTTRELNDGLKSGNSDQLRAAAARLSEFLRQISQQLDQDRHAILELAEQAKSADSSMPLARRYRRVLDAYWSSWGRRRLIAPSRCDDQPPGFTGSMIARTMRELGHRQLYAEVVLENFPLHAVID